MRCAWLVKVVLAGSVAGCLGLFGVHTRLRNVRFTAAAEKYLWEARFASSAGTTAEDAKKWIASNGLHLKQSGDDNFVSELSQPNVPKINVVSGYKLLAPASGVYAERWMELSFDFRTTDEQFVAGSFLGVDVSDDSAPTPWFRSQFPAATQSTN